MNIFPLFEGLGMTHKDTLLLILWAYITSHISLGLHHAPHATLTTGPLRPVTSRISSASSGILNHFATEIEKKIPEN